MVVQLSPSLIKRQKSHFHNLPCGASVILGNNGYVWLYPTPENQEEEAGGFYTSLEVGERCTKSSMQCWEMYLVKSIFMCIFLSSLIVFFVHLLPLSFQPVSLSDREVISRLRNCLLALAAHKVLLFDTSVLYCYESSLQHPVGGPVVYNSVCNLI